MPHPKLQTEAHGRVLTEEYIQYAATDVQATWECYRELNRRYLGLQLDRTPITRIFSEASLGKAYLRQMGVMPWRHAQPDFPAHLIGLMMSTYYGGRSEIHIRRQQSQVLYCDFLSMYPTVCILMHLWRFVIANGLTYDDATEEIRSLLATVEVHDLQQRDWWAQLPVLVQIIPADDILPVRAQYNGTQYSIGVNRLSSEQPLWYTLADCVASKLLTGRPPRIVKALRFRPGKMQRGLQPVKIAGNAAYEIAPTQDDFYQRLIELRQAVKSRMKSCDTPDDKQKLDTEQLALKICANATSYGIFVELNVLEEDRRTEVQCYGQREDAFTAWVRNIEAPGTYFTPC